MIRKIITIDEDKCNGCGLCASACHEGALRIIDGKAKLISDSYCDGLGNCLPECPTNAIRIVEREAAAFDEEAVAKHVAAGSSPAGAHAPASAGVPRPAVPSEPAVPHLGCPGSRARMIHRSAGAAQPETAAPSASAAAKPVSQLGQWPCQIKLVPANAPYFDNANLLIAADCTAYAYANIHQDFMRNKITLIGCPKLDEGDYSQKLAQIFANNDLKSITVLRMEVPCCGGLVHAVKNAMLASGTMVPWKVVTISTDGNIIEV
jgi:ferredoxin